MDVFYLITGLGLLLLGGESLLRGSVAVAEKLKLSTLFVSMVLIGFGTSAPELMVSVAAAGKGAPSIALGNVIGSNIANILLILGVAALLSPVVCRRDAMMRDVYAMLVASVVLAGLALVGVVSLIAGLLLFTALISYVVYVYRQNRKNMQENPKLHGSVAERAHVGEDAGAPSISIFLAVIMCLAGFLLLVSGAHFLVAGATAIAQRFGVSDAVIGLTIVAVGTSLPELATTVAAARKAHTDVVVGNVIGSNLFNILSVLGVTAMVSPIPFAGRLAVIDVWLMLAVTVVLGLSVWTGRKISRNDGIIFVSVYIIYTIWAYTAGA